MASHQKHFHLLLFSTFLVLLPFFCAGGEPLHTYCDNGGTGRRGQMTYHIDRVLRFVIAYASVDGFSTIAEGNGEERIYGLAQCRRDVSKEDCITCLNDAADQIPGLCRDQVDARIWFDHCFVRYDNEDFFGKVDTDIARQGPDDSETVPEPERFDVELRKLLDDVLAQAILPGSKGLGKGQTNFTASLTLHALFQCTEDLSSANCGVCLSESKQTFLDRCLHRKACKVINSSCYAFYAFHPL